MPTSYFSHNGQLLPISEAVIPLDDIAYSYGYGVYETLRIVNGIVYFSEQHYDRLLQSAATIRLDHMFDAARIETWVAALVAANKLTTANIKILLIGGRTASDAQLYIQSLNPHFVPRVQYRDGVHAITIAMERSFPTAKTLNMLPSYIAYQQASKAQAHDALLVDANGIVREGTRTNFFVLSGKTIITTPHDMVLSGVMRQAVMRVAQQAGYEIQEAPIALSSLATYDAAFLTSTSTKILPIHSIDTTISYDFGGTALPTLIKQFDSFYKECNGLLG